MRRPGAIQIHGHHTSSLPALGEPSVAAAGRPSLRLIGVPQSGDPDMYVVDITSGSVKAMLEGFLGSGVGVGKILTWQSSGFGPRRRDTVHLRSR